MKDIRGISRRITYDVLINIKCYRRYVPNQKLSEIALNLNDLTNEAHRTLGLTYSIKLTSEDRIDKHLKCQPYKFFTKNGRDKTARNLKKHFEKLFFGKGVEVKIIHSGKAEKLLT